MSLGEVRHPNPVQITYVAAGAQRVPFDREVLPVPASKIEDYSYVIGLSLFLKLEDVA